MRACRHGGDAMRSYAPTVVSALLLLATFGESPASPLFAAAFLSYDTGNGETAVAIGDLNADGKPDLAVANVGSNTVSVLLGNGDGNFGAKTDFGTGDGPRTVAYGDVEEDGEP